jgi:hypothetical protein
MNVEDVIRTHLQETSSRIPLAPVRLDVVLRGARRKERFHRAAVGVGVAACLAVGAVGVNAVWPEADKGRQLTPPVAPATGTLSETLSEDDARNLMDRFIQRLEAGDVDGSRALLTEGARTRAGNRDEWQDAMGPLRARLSWIPDDAVNVTVTSLSTWLGDRNIATFTAPVEDGSALLHPVAMKVVNGEPLLDLASAQLRHSVSLEPEVPQIFACTPGCDPREMWPEIGDGTTLSVLLGPDEKVADVWFAVGGNAWASKATVTAEGDSFVRAQATFDAADVPPGVNVLVVAIETTDFRLETYGYRVRI